MELNEYQKQAMETCLPLCENCAYMLLNLVGEVGEFAGKLGKAIRHGNIKIDNNKIQGGIASETMELEDWIYFYDELKKEAGDILWQLSGLCQEMGWTLEEVAQENLDKLASRKTRGVIDGSGDNR